MAEHPVLKKPLERDDAGAVVVLVFPKYPEGATEPMPHWYAAANSIFHTKTAPAALKQVELYKTLCDEKERKVSRDVTTKELHHMMRKSFNCSSVPPMTNSSA